MANVLKNFLLTPAVWLAAALMLFASSISLGYYQDHKVAVEAMAKPRGPAPLVNLQDFDADKHANLNGEIRLIAEVDFGRVFGVNLEGEHAPSPAILIPLYPVSEAGLVTARRAAAGLSDMRPFPRADRPVSAAAPIGAILSRSPRAVASNLDLDRFIARRIGPGLHGTVVEVSGIMRPALLANKAVAPLADDLLSNRSTVLVEPFEFQADPAFLASGSNTVRLVLTRLGLVLLLVAALFAVRPVKDSQPLRSHPPKPSNPRVASSVTPHRSFEPLASQDEIFDAEMLDAEKAAAARREGSWNLAVPFKSRR